MRSRAAWRRERFLRGSSDFESAKREFFALTQKRSDRPTLKGRETCCLNELPRKLLVCRSRGCYASFCFGNFRHTSRGLTMLMDFFHGRYVSTVISLSLISRAILQWRRCAPVKQVFPSGRREFESFSLFFLFFFYTFCGVLDNVRSFECIKLPKI